MRYTLLYSLALVAGLASFQPSPAHVSNEDLHRFTNRLVAQGKVDGAVAVYRELFKREPKNESNYVECLSILISTDSLDDAKKVLVEAHKQCPASAELWFLDGFIYDKLKETQRVSTSFSKAFAIDSNKEKYILGKVRALALNHKNEEAKALAKTKATQFGNSLDLWESLLEASLDAEDEDTAQLAIERLCIAEKNGFEKMTVSKDSVIKAAWRLIALNQWNRKSYPLLLRLCVALDKKEDSFKLVQLAHRKYTDDSAMFQSLLSELPQDTKSDNPQHDYWKSCKKLLTTLTANASRVEQVNKIAASSAPRIK